MHPSLPIGLLLIGICIPPRIGAQSLSGCKILPANNVWNTPVDSLPVDPNSAEYINTIGARTRFHADFGSDPNNGIPFNLVDGRQPNVPIVFGPEAADESDPGPYPVPSNARIEGGSGSKGDRHVLVLETTNCILYELYSAVPQADGSWQAYSGAVFNLRSNALRPRTWTSADAAGLPILPGLVRYDEILTGEIKHALRFTVPQTRNTFIWPARHKASSRAGVEYPPMGQRFRLKASFDAAQASSAGKIILTAMQKYGIILADNGSPWYITGTTDPRWNDDRLHKDFLLMQGSDFEAVDESGLIVDTDSGQALQASPSVSVSPIDAGGTTQTFNVTFSSSASVNDLNVGFLLFNASLNPSGACWIYYVRSSNSMYLINDAGDGAVPGLSNSQCTIANAGSATVSGNNLTVPLMVTFTASFSGSKNVYAYVSNNDGSNSGWQTLGTWLTVGQTIGFSRLPARGAFQRRAP